MSTLSIYADYNATTPVAPEVFAAMSPYLTRHFGNPGCVHDWGFAAKEAMNLARSQAGQALGADPSEIVFTSGATESDNWALFGVFGAQPAGALVTTAVEHPAILAAAAELERRGVRVTRVPVDGQGLVSPDDVLAACGPDTKLVSVMLANNETGAVQPVAEITRRLAGRGILTHTDAAQAVGKIPVNVADLGVDLLTVAGHKCYAPKGMGALYIRKGTHLHPLLFGGGQEHGLRSGTENIPYMVALGAAMTLVTSGLEAEAARLRDLGELFLGLLRTGGPDFRLHSAEAPRLPNTYSIGFRNLRTGDILSGLVGEDVGVSGGAACHHGETKASYVLEAMRAPEEYAHGTIRFSFGRYTSRQEIEELAARLLRVLRGLQAPSA